MAQPYRLGSTTGCPFLSTSGVHLYRYETEGLGLFLGRFERQSLRQRAAGLRIVRAPESGEAFCCVIHREESLCHHCRRLAD
jgi:hypothetical protein